MTIVVAFVYLEKEKQMRDSADVRKTLFHSVYAHTENESAIKSHRGNPRNTVIK